MAELSMKIILGVLLLVCGVQDSCSGKIHIRVIMLGAIFTAACLPFCTSLSVLERLSGFAIGAAVLIISKITGGKIGLGDGLLLCITGLGLGFWGNLELFGIALFFAALISIVLLVLRLVDRKKSIPFVPFMLLAYLFLMAAAKGNPV